MTSGADLQFVLLDNERKKFESAVLGANDTSLDDYFIEDKIVHVRLSQHAPAR